jgi:hypothetical protein
MRIRADTRISSGEKPRILPSRQAAIQFASAGEQMIGQLFASGSQLGKAPLFWLLLSFAVAAWLCLVASIELTGCRRAWLLPYQITSSSKW